MHAPTAHAIVCPVPRASCLRAVACWWLVGGLLVAGLSWCPVSSHRTVWQAGEMDFLETGWNLRNISDDPQYRKSYSTQYNQIGRCQ